jgi:hypothetical protein
MAVHVDMIAEWLGADFKSDFDLAQIIRRGTPLDTQTVLLSHGFTKEEFHLIVIPARTFRHRREHLNKEQQEMLSSDESDKALRGRGSSRSRNVSLLGRDKALGWDAKTEEAV